MRRLHAGLDARKFELLLGRLPLAAALTATLAAIGALYWPATAGPFQFDDYNVIVDNPAVHSLPAWFDSMPGIRPLLKLSYTLNWVLAPQPLPQPFGFHLFNVGCHLLNGALVFLILRRLNAEHRRAGLIAFSGAALFALHPAQTEAVTYICGRSVALMSLFYLAAIYTWLNARRAASLALFLCALLVKETAWTLPFALLLIELARGASLTAAVQRLWPQWATLAGGACLLLTIDDYRRLLAHSLAIRDMSDNLRLQIAGQFYLLTQPLLLLRTNIDPDPAHSASALTPALVLGALYAAGLVMIARAFHLRWIGFALLWFFLHLLPTNSLLPRNDIANDRQLYLALIGPALIVARSLVTLLQVRMAAPALGVLALLLATKTWQRNDDYRSEVALWQAAAQHSPDKPRVWNNLGFAYQQQGDIEAARAAYRRALLLDPEAVRARINLGLLESAGPLLRMPHSDGTPAGK
ncbi:MAG: tetratricopeptide repeat protein [Spongiibacteraceae bacterium]